LGTKQGLGTHTTSEFIYRQPYVMYTHHLKFLYCYNNVFPPSALGQHRFSPSSGRVLPNHAWSLHELLTSGSLSGAVFFCSSPEPPKCSMLNRKDPQTVLSGKRSGTGTASSPASSTCSFSPKLQPCLSLSLQETCHASASNGAQLPPSVHHHSSSARRAFIPAATAEGTCSDHTLTPQPQGEKQG